MYYKGIIKMKNDAHKIVRMKKSEIAHFVCVMKKVRNFRNLGISETINSQYIRYDDVESAKFMEMPSNTLLLEI